jgi:hypothetical protein
MERFEGTGSFLAGDEIAFAVRFDSDQYKAPPVEEYSEVIDLVAQEVDLLFAEHRQLIEPSPPQESPGEKMIRALLLADESQVLLSITRRSQPLSPEETFWVDYPLLIFISASFQGKNKKMRQLIYSTKRDEPLLRRREENNPLGEMMRFMEAADALEEDEIFETLGAVAVSQEAGIDNGLVESPHKNFDFSSRRASDFARLAFESAQNKKMAEALGYNNCPVGSQEANRLIDLVRKTLREGISVGAALDASIELTLREQED